MPAKKFDYEAAILRLEEINRILADGNITLKESLTLYEEGAKLAAACKQELDAAQQRIAEVTLTDE
ncbi:MAG: exodeoxyribonuclease VII small subunit [Clostridia bacterium]|nr:exodeoxyribonuclease VII small subunit [Clostridia bacterium]